MVFPRAMDRASRAALLAAFVILIWWTATVRLVYGGHWNALYCTGSTMPLPAWLEEREALYRNFGPAGYDGQFAHLLAHAPWRMQESARFMDWPRLRCQRILLPLAAYLLALGRFEAVDAAYFAWMLALLAAGVYWTARLAELRGAKAWWGLAFLVLPSTLSSIDRMLADGPLAAAAAGFFYFWETGRWRLAAAVALAAPFIRETGMLLALSAAAVLLSRGRLRAALRWAAALGPMLVWLAWLSRLSGGMAARFQAPFHAILRLLAQPQDYATSAPPVQSVLRVADLIALATSLLCCALALWLVWRRRQEVAASPRAVCWLCAALFGAAALVTSHLEPRHGWDDLYSHGRVYSPVYLAVFLDRLAAGRPGQGAALLSAAGFRMLLQFASPLVRILRALGAF